MSNIICNCCGKPARWCNEGEAACGDKMCAHIHCDHCGMHFSLESKEVNEAETHDKWKELTLRAYRPRPSHQQVADEIIKSFDEDNDEVGKKVFIECSEDSLIRYHHLVGRWVRNHCNLWIYPWTPEIREDGCDYSDFHPDNFSFVALRLAHKQLNVREAEKTRIKRMEDALQLLASNQHNDLGADPSKWACTIAKVALGLPPNADK